MPNPFDVIVPIPSDDGVNAKVGVGEEIRIDQLTNKGFDSVIDGAKTFTGVLEGTVAGGTWTTIDALAATADGPVAAHLQRVRVKVTVVGVIGSTTRVKATGTNL